MLNLNLSKPTEKDNNSDRRIFESEILKAFNLLKENEVLENKLSKIFRLKKSNALFVITTKKGYSVRMWCETDSYEVKVGKFEDFVKDQPKNLLFYLLKNQPDEIILEKK